MAEFFFLLDRNLEDVDCFYNKKYDDAARRLKLLQDRYGKPSDFPNGIERDEMEDLMGALLELRSHLRKLQWYGEVNRRGFIKITKKLDKKVPRMATQGPYLVLKVNPKQFASSSALSETMHAVNGWLSALGEMKIYDDRSSTHSSQSIHRVLSKAILSLPAGILDDIAQAVHEDNAKALETLLHDSIRCEIMDISFTTLALKILQRAISCRAEASIDILFEHIDCLHEDDDINNRNCIHRLVIAIGRAKSAYDEQIAVNGFHDGSLGSTNFIKPATIPVLIPLALPSGEPDSVADGYDDEKTVLFLQFLLNALRPHQRDALCARDAYGRMPLHYAAQYGFFSICQIIIARMQSWGQYEAREGVDAPFWQDLEGYTPLHLSVMNGHSLTTQALLEAEDWRGPIDREIVFQKHMQKSGDVLALATKANYIKIVKLLVEAGVDLNYQDDQGETALHVAARFNRTKCAEILLTGSDRQKANTELKENTFGWTPLFVSCVEGHLDIVKLLVGSGADLRRLDTSDWTAKEHAALRGHMDIWRTLVTLAAAPDPYDSESTGTDSPPLSTHQLISDRNLDGTMKGAGAPRSLESVKTFGHRYLKAESMVLVSLGSMDMRKGVEAVSLDRIPLTNAHSTQLDTALSLVVSANGANGEPSITDLPVQDNVNTEPIVFTAVDPTKVQLLFDIVPTYAGNNEKVVGRGVALLSSIKPSIGSKRITLQGDVAVPIIAASNLEVIGTVNFNFLIITPFSHASMNITENQMYWKSMTSTLVIGHRGDFLLGKYSFGALLTTAKVWAKTWLHEAHYSLVRILSR